MENYAEVMKPLVVITEAIGAEKWVTISTVRPLLHKLLNVHFKAKPTDNKQQKTLKTTIHSDLQQRYTGELLHLLSKAAFLDPRLKALSFLSPLEKDELRAAIQEEVAAVVEPSQSTEDASAEPPPVKRAKGEHKLLELIDDVI